MLFLKKRDLALPLGELSALPTERGNMTIPKEKARWFKTGCGTLSVTCGDSSPKGRAKGPPHCRKMEMQHVGATIGRPRAADRRPYENKGGLPGGRWLTLQIGPASIPFPQTENWQEKSRTVRCGF